MKMNIRRPYLIAGAGVLVIVAVAAVKIAFRRPAASARRQIVPIVRVEKPSRDTILYTLSYTGDVVSIQQANIVAKVGGSLEQVLVNIGAQVRQNQLLALIDTVELAQQVLQADAALFTAQADYDRTKQLLADSLVARQNFEHADEAVKVAQANYQTARARLGYAHIRAPFSGTITARDFDPGAIVSPNASTVFTLMNLDSVKVAINVLEKDVPSVSVGARASVLADALPDDTLLGRVGRLSQAVDPATRTMLVEVFVPNKDHRLKPGMYATVALVLAEHPDAITIPTEAVLRDADGTFVYTVENKTAHRKPVETGHEQGTITEIIAGLGGGESIITTGQQYVRDNGPVSVQP